MSEFERRRQLVELERLRDELHAAEMAVHRQAVVCREVGCSWQELGAVLGMTAKSAWKRYVRS